MTRWRSCSGSGTRAGPSSIGLRGQGNDRAVPFPRTRLTHADRNAPAPARAARLQLQRPEDVGAAPRDARGRRRRHAEVADICASFQRVVVETLLDRLFDAARAHGARSVGHCGRRVGQQPAARATRSRAARPGHLPVFIPSLALSTDNAAMIAAAGLRRFAPGVTAGGDLNADASLPLL